MGRGFRSVVKESVYTTDIDAFMRNKDVPAAIRVQLQSLYLPSHVVEIELVTVLPSNSRKHHH